MNKLIYKDAFKKPGNIIALFGNSGCGKTTMLKHIIRENSETFTNVYIYQGSQPNEDNVYTDIAWPDDITVVNNDVDKKKDVIDNIKKEMDDIINFVTRINSEITDSNKKNPKNTKKLMHILFIFDDLTKESNKFNDYLGKLRHCPVTMILLLHNATNIDKTFRAAITYFIINVNFELNQLGETFPRLKENLGQLRKNKTDNRLFLAYDVENNKSYFSMVEREDFEKLKKDPYTVFKRHSKQRQYLEKYLKELASEGIRKN